MANKKTKEKSTKSAESSLWEERNKILPSIISEKPVRAKPKNSKAKKTKAKKK